MKTQTPNTSFLRRGFWPYVVAVFATALATLLRMALAPLLGAGSPFLTYFVAALFVVWYFGFAAASVTIGISIAAASHFFLSPASTSLFFLTTRGDRVTVFGFTFGTLTAVFLVDLQRRTLARVREEATHRKFAEEAEREQRQWFETTLASIGDAVIVTDAEGRVMFMNGVASELTEWDIAAAQTVPLREVFHIVNEADRSPIENPIENVIKYGTRVGLANHTILVSRTGREIPIDDSAAPIKRDGRSLGAVLVFRDSGTPGGAAADRELRAAVSIAL